MCSGSDQNYDHSQTWTNYNFREQQAAFQTISFVVKYHQILCFASFCYVVSIIKYAEMRKANYLAWQSPAIILMTISSL